MIAPTAMPSATSGALSDERTANGAAASAQRGQRPSVAMSSTSTVTRCAQAVRHGPSPSSYCSASARATTGSEAAVVVGSPCSSSNVTPDPVASWIVSVASEVTNSSAPLTVSLDSSIPDIRANTADNSSAIGV